MSMLPPRDTHEGLQKLIQGEQLPLYPKLRESKLVIELEKWIQNLYVYLRRLTGHFSAANIINLLVDNHVENYITLPPTGIQKYVNKKYSYTSKPSTTTTVTVDNTVDWRKYTVLYSMRARDSATPGTTIDTDMGAGGGVTQGVIDCTAFPNPGGYPAVITGSGGAIVAVTLQVSSTGVLELKCVQTPAASNCFIDIAVAAFHLVSPEGSAGSIAI